MRQFGKLAYVCHVQPGISNCLRKNKPGTFIDCRIKSIPVIIFHVDRPDAKRLKIPEKVDAAAIQAGACHNLVTTF